MVCALHFPCGWNAFFWMALSRVSMSQNSITTTMTALPPCSGTLADVDP